MCRPGYDELVRSLTDKLSASKQTLLAEVLGEWFEKLREEK